MMISKEKSVERVTQAYATRTKGLDYGLITNEKLLGERPDGEIAEAGVDALASCRRSDIESVLEDDHGIGLVPHDYRGTFKVVPLEIRVAHLMLIRLRRIRKLIQADEASGRSSMLKGTVEKYLDNRHLSDEFVKKVLKPANKTTQLLEDIADRLLSPDIDRLEKLLLPYELEADDEE